MALFRMADKRKEQLKQLILWRDKDVKGKSKNLYTKDLVAKNVNILTVVKQSRLEQAQN